MPFKTHTEGGGWLGGGKEVPNCSITKQAAIKVAFALVQTIGRPCVAAIGGLDGLANCLSGKTVDTVDIDCCGSSCGPTCSDAFATTDSIGGNLITFCNPALPPTYSDQNDCDATAFHELVHSCGGMEIDAWSLENHCYLGRGTINPSSIVVQGFLSETTDIGGGLRAGNFVVWERSTGKVFVKVVSGGGWLSSPTISKGNPINVNPAAYTI